MFDVVPTYCTYELCGKRPPVLEIWDIEMHCYRFSSTFNVHFACGEDHVSFSGQKLFIKILVTFVLSKQNYVHLAASCIDY